MGATAQLQQATVPVDPGSAATVALTVRNTGSVVDQFTIEVLGDAAAWASADPPSLSLFPGAEGTTTISFRPPRTSGTPAGELRFGVRVHSTEDPSGSTVEEGTLQVGAFLAPSVELIPRTSHGSRAGHHDLALDNRGNTPLRATVAGHDPDRLVHFDVDPPTLAADPGVAAFGKVAVRPAKTFWRGTPKSRAFQLSIQPDAPGAAPLLLDGSYVQESILPSWFLRAIAALVALIVGAALLWVFLLQPQIKSTAAQTLADFGFSPKPGSVAAGGGGGGGGGTGNPSPSAAVTVTPPPNGAQQPVDGRLDTTHNAVTPSGGTLYLTDLVFSNPTGASGDLTLQRTSTSGTSQLLVLRLDNFRDLDFHFVTPIAVQSGETLALIPSCTAPTTPTNPPPACSPALFYSGYVKG
ncbi:MAG TPA: hypothetical protein VFW20_05365 [Candidatus Limnocylindrales bacterium]|nr:hypothetical protein [Candidatus Limnocylindrales bacterium]